MASIKQLDERRYKSPLVSNARKLMPLAQAYSKLGYRK